MKPFLQGLAERITAQYHHQEIRLCVILPSRRAVIFLRDYLSRIMPSQSLQPEVITIEDLVQELSQVTLLDKVSLAFELFPIYQDLFPDEGFDTYYAWGQMLAADFDEVDQSLADAGQLFRNLFSLREIDATIDTWALEGEDRTAYRERYLRFWGKMGEMYTRFRQKLRTQRLASGGMALRDLAERISAERPQMPWDHLIFAGFNALGAAEELLIRSLRLYGLADCYWDLDAYYTEDEVQEAGAFFRSLRRAWKLEQPEWISRELLEGKKEIEIIGVPQRVGQAKAAGILLENLHAAGVNQGHTAVVLPEEGLLFPLLHSLPETSRDINVTMGFPLRNTPMYSLVEGLIQLHEGAEALRPGRERSSVYFHRDVTNLLRHPYIHSPCWQDAEELLQDIREHNRIYISPAFFEKYPEDHLFRLVFQPWEGISPVVEHLLELFRRLKPLLAGPGGESRRQPSLETEYLFQFYTLTQKLRDKLEAWPMNLEAATFRKLLREVLSRASIPFSGEPLRGLQVMGMLETRLLDFDTLILLSANEDILPANSRTPSFIPYNLRKAFGIPTHEEKDALYAYHFYRLLQRPSRIFILYNTHTDQTGGGEKSRFVLQLEHELPRKNPNIQLKSGHLTFPTHRETPADTVIYKDPVVLNLLLDFGQQRGFSPSVLTTYLQCSLRFYYRYVLRLHENEEPEENMEAHTFGKVVHETLHRLYEPWLGAEIQPADILAMLPEAETTLLAAFRSVTRNADPEFGRNRLLLGVIRLLLDKLLRLDAQEAPFTVLRLEEEVQAHITLPGHTVPVLLKGVMDRVDRRGDRVRIVDYKTGKRNDTRLRSWDDLRDTDKRKEGFQLALYAWLYLSAYPETAEVNPGIYFLRDLDAGFEALSITVSAQTETLNAGILPELTAELQGILTELYDPAEPFRMTEETDRCKYCPYTVMCVRNSRNSD